MEGIIELQLVDGSWEMSTALVEMIRAAGKPESPPTIFESGLKKKEERVKAWMTVCALWLLETFCGGK